MRVWPIGVGCLILAIIYLRIQDKIGDGSILISLIALVFFLLGCWAFSRR